MCTHATAMCLAAHLLIFPAYAGEAGAEIVVLNFTTIIGLAVFPISITEQKRARVLVA